MYAVFETGGKQYRASAGDTVTVEKLDAEAGKPVTFDRVLLVSNDGQVTVGSPLVEQANVVGGALLPAEGETELVVLQGDVQVGPRVVVVRGEQVRIVED